MILPREEAVTPGCPGGRAAGTAAAEQRRRGRHGGLLEKPDRV